MIYILKLSLLYTTVRQASTKKVGLALKLQITNYKKNSIHFRVYEMLFKKGFPGFRLKVFAKKTKS